MLHKLTPLFLTLFLISGCSSSTKEATAVAKVGGRKISLQMFEAKMSRIAHLPGKDLSSASQKKELLDEMINEELLFQSALKDGVVEKSERLKREIAREYLTQKMGADRYEPTDKEIEETYEKKKGELERVRASHILIKPVKPGDSASEAAAKKKAEVLLAKIRKGGATIDFAKLAQENSDDPGTKARGGDLFFFTREKMVPEFSQVAFSLPKVGDISDVVKTAFGYHIIKLTGEQRGLDFFRHSVKWQISQEKQKERSAKMFETLRGKASIKVYDDVLANAKATAPAAPAMPAGMMHPEGGVRNPMMAPGAPNARAPQ